MAIVDDEKRKRTAFPTDIPEQSIYGRGAVPQAAQPAAPAPPKKNTAFPSNPPTRSIYDAPRPDVGFGALAGRVTMQPVADDAASMAKRPLVESATSGPIANYKPALAAPAAALVAPMPRPDVAGMANRPLVDSATGGPIGAFRAQVPAQPQQAAQPGGFGMFPGVRAVMSGAGENMSSLANRGQYGAAVGEAARSTAAMIPAAIDDVVVSPLTPAMHGVGSGLRQFFTGGAESQQATPEAAAPATRPEPKKAQPSPTDPNAPAAAAIVAATPTSVSASQESPQTPTAQQGIQRIDKPGASPLFTNLPADDPSNVSMMARGAPTAQNMAAAGALASRYASQSAKPPQGDSPVAVIPKSTGGFGLLSSDYQQDRSRKMEMQRGMGESARAYSARMSAFGASQNAQTSRDGSQLNADVARERIAQETGLGAMRNQLDQQRAGLDAAKAQDDMATNQVRRDASQVEIDAARQAADLQRQYLEAPTEEARAEVAKKISALSGKSAGAAKDNFIVVGGGQEWDQASGLMRNVPQRLIDVRTGQEVGAPAGQKPSAPAQQSFVSGQTYTDAQGNKARWDGEKFVPVK